MIYNGGNNMAVLTVSIEDDLYTQLKELNGDNSKGISKVVSTLIKLGMTEYTKLNNFSDKVLESYYLNNIYTSVKGLNEIRKKRIEGGLEG